MRQHQGIGNNGKQQTSNVRDTPFIGIRPHDIVQQKVQEHVGDGFQQCIENRN